MKKSRFADEPLLKVRDIAAHHGCSVDASAVGRVRGYRATRARYAWGASAGL